MASRSRNGGRHIDTRVSAVTLNADLLQGNRHTRRRAKALLRAAWAETRPNARKRAQGARHKQVA